MSRRVRHRLWLPQMRQHCCLEEKSFRERSIRLQIPEIASRTSRKQEGEETMQIADVATHAQDVRTSERRKCKQTQKKILNASQAMTHALYLSFPQCDAGEILPWIIAGKWSRVYIPKKTFTNNKSGRSMDDGPGGGGYRLEFRNLIFQQRSLNNRDLKLDS